MGCILCPGCQWETRNLISDVIVSAINCCRISANSITLRISYRMQSWKVFRSCVGSPSLKNQYWCNPDGYPGYCYWEEDTGSHGASMKPRPHLSLSRMPWNQPQGGSTDAHKRFPVKTLGSKPLETSLGFKTHYIMPIIDRDFRCLLEISACCRTVNCCKGLRRTCLVSFKDAIKPIPFPICAGSSLTCKEDVSRGNQLSRCIHITVSNPIGPMFCICSTNKRTNERTNKQTKSSNQSSNWATWINGILRVELSY